MAHESLLSKLPLHQDSVHPWPTYIEDPKKVAGNYASEIEHFFQGPPAFDLMLLGLGADCHTASLFPHTPALTEKDDLAVANWVDDLDDYRFTLTFPVINDSVNTVFLVSGESKAKALASVLEGYRRPGQFPAQSVQPKNDQLYWLVDEAAASLLQNRERLHFRQTET
jgi:6-phosphogluconolactonase